MVSIKKTFLITLLALIFGTVFAMGVFAQEVTPTTSATSTSPSTTTTYTEKEKPKENQENVENQENQEKQENTNEKPENSVIQGITNSLDFNLDLQRENFTLKADLNGKIINTFEDPDTKEIYLYVPSQIDATSILLRYTGDVTSVSYGTLDTSAKTIIFNANESNYIDFTFSNNTTKRVNIIVSNLPCVQIDLKDELSLDTVKDNSKEIKYPDNTVSITDPTGENALAPTGGVEFKGRGNNTWGNRLKKPYQIKFAKKTSVLGMPKAKKWVLLANMNDAALMRNNLVFDMARESGELAPDSRFVDVYVNGNYEGNYTITEKVDANRCGVNFESDEGVLVEMDNNYYQEEDHYYQDANSNAHFVLKDSQADDADKENSVSLKAFKQFESKEKAIGSIINGSKDWDALNQYLDTDSLIYFYLMQELTENIDSAQSSMFLYQDGPNDKIHFGPFWDYDNSMGNMSDQTSGNWLMRESRKNQRINWFVELRKMPEFNKRVGEIYREKFAPSLNSQIQAIDGKQQTLELSGTMNYHRYHFLGNMNAMELGSHASYDDAVQEVRNWLTQRKAYLDSQFTGVHVGYNAHLADIGWQDNKVDGEEAGTTGQARRMEAIGVYLNSSDIPGNIETRSFVDGMGWLGWKTDGKFTGTTGQYKALHALEFRLTGDIAEQYDIYYRAHAANIGWMGWTKNGQSVGTIGYGLPIEAVQICLVSKDSNNVPMTEDTNIPAFQKKNINCLSHVQNIGWMNPVGDGEICGTTSRSLRLEAIKLNLNSPEYEGGIQYQTHIQNIGWENRWKSNGEMSGTQGRSLQAEAIRINLTGEMANHYDVYYRSHTQNIGWMGWAKNGESAGSTGHGYRMEAVQVVLVEKGKSPEQMYFASNTGTKFVWR